MLLMLNREGFFKKGNKYGAGRPLTMKHQMEVIRRRILRIVSRRIVREKDLETVSTTDLLKFVATIMPKETTLGVAPMKYISNIPREQIVSDLMNTIDSDSQDGNNEDKTEPMESEVATPLEEQAPIDVTATVPQL